MFLGSFYPQTLFFITETPKRPYLTRKQACWAINGRDRSSAVTCRCGQEYKKRTQKVTENALTTQTPFPSSHINHIFARGVASRISFLVSSFTKIGWKMWEQWGVKILAFPLTWHIAYTTACCYRTSRDSSSCGNPSQSYVRSVSCHVGSHSVILPFGTRKTCSAITPTKQDYTRYTYPGWMKG